MTNNFSEVCSKYPTPISSNTNMFSNPKYYRVVKIDLTAAGITNKIKKNYKKNCRLEPGFSAMHPTPITVHKASSDDFKKRADRKIKKSVLTLPNKQAPLPQNCTVSDLNDSEYFERETQLTKSKKKRVLARRKSHGRGRDTRFCSEITFDMDSSNHMLNDYECLGPERQHRSTDLKDIYRHHDVMDLLQNIGRIKYSGCSPQTSETVLRCNGSPRNLITTKSKHRQNTGILETHTEETAYIRNVNLKHCPFTYTPGSATGRITTMVKNRNITEDLIEIEKTFTTREKVKRQYYGVNRNQRKINNDQDRCLMLTNGRSQDERQSLRQSYLKRSRDLGEIYNTKPIEKKYIQTHQNLFEKGQLCGELNGSLAKEINKSINENNIEKRSSKSPDKQLNGDSSATGQDADSPMKFTVKEIKRRIARMRFPLIILRREELTSPLLKIQQALPQFDGLDKHIWPFMQNWHRVSECSPDNTKKTRYTCSKSACKTVTMKDRKNLNAGSSGKASPRGFEAKQKTSTSADSKLSHSELTSRKNRRFHSLEMKVSPNECKPVQNPEEYEDGDRRKFSELPLRKEYSDASTDTCYINRKLQRESSSSPVNVRRRFNEIHNRARKGTSDYIEDIISKIERGVYHNQEIIKPPSPKDASIQTSITIKAKFICNDIEKLEQQIIAKAEKTETPKYSNSETMTDFESCQIIDTIQCKNKGTQQLNNNYVNKGTQRVTQIIPSINNSFTHLEIINLGKSQIAVKHCTANVVVEFDIVIQPSHDNIDIAKASLVPVPLHGSPIKLFKCTAALLNGVLPAQLCSVVPNIMRNITGTYDVIPPPKLNHTTSQLSTITELSRTDVSQYYLGPKLSIFISPELTELLNGSFETKSKNVDQSSRLRKFKHMPTDYDYRPMFCRRQLFNFEVNIQSLNSIIKKENEFTKKNSPTTEMLLPLRQKSEALHVHNECKALVPYVRPNEKSLTGTVIVINFSMENSVSTLHIMSKMISIDLNLLNQLKSIKCVVDQRRPMKKIVHNEVRSASTCLEIDVVKTKPTFEEVDCKAVSCNILNEPNHKTISVACGKNKSKKNMKLNKKSKSSSNISSTKSSVPISKIKSLDEFLSVIGITSAVCSMFDRTTEKKILLYLAELKNWVSEITPQQAMLLLLISNKKESINLVRYRSIILQGIAVNRITKVAELDLEVGILETEKMNKIAQCDAISYFPGVGQNKEQLLEELEWIAKTTASDHKRPFDDASEKLLKSLLEKRKNLNPSYLRVLARYVGLGLLQTPIKKSKF